VVYLNGLQAKNDISTLSYVVFITNDRMDRKYIKPMLFYSYLAIFSTAKYS